MKKENKNILCKLNFFQNFFISMGAILAIVAYELQNTNIKEHQDIVNSFWMGESNTPELNTNLTFSTCFVEQCLEAESDQEPSLKYTLPNDRYVDKV